ncbi:hypothetical protein CgunFtcFv8_008987 [Champsocephalus gunnari]|uniref:Uncharacterized protein n=1 Tax=Champsocephalus gunnari TaxID=52237 RepID=A0AAN8HFP7_CHAGU|nr:hypothetical protein CgunFtcFv8_008987 [Champsocephalus gunnari]
MEPHVSPSARVEVVSLGGGVLLKCVPASATTTVRQKLCSFKRQKRAGGFIPSLSGKGEFYTEGVQGVKTSAIKEGIYGGQSRGKSGGQSRGKSGGSAGWRHGSVWREDSAQTRSFITS